MASEAAAKYDGHDGKVMTANEPGLAGLTHGWKAYLLVDNIKSLYERATTGLTLTCGTLQPGRLTATPKFRARATERGARLPSQDARRKEGSE